MPAKDIVLELEKTPGELLDLEPHEIVRAMRNAPGVDIYALGLSGEAG